MRITFSRDDWTINSVRNREGRIDPKPQYQRTEVWTPKKKQLLIDSILRGYDLPKFYLRSSTNGYEHEVVDGQQRLLAIWDFRDDQYTLGNTSKDIPNFGDLSGRKFSELPSEAQDQFGEFKLNLVVIEEASDLEIRQLFLRLQEGVSLNPPEKRNAMSGNMRNFVADLGENHRIFRTELIRLSDTRFQWHDLVAIVTCLEIAGGPTDVKAPSLKKMYEDEQEFNNNGTISQKVKRYLNYMARVFEVPETPIPETDIKWGFVDLYLLISKMDASYAISQRERDFKNFYITFEGERRENMSDYGSLRAGQDIWNRDLYNYIEAFIRSGGRKKNINTRHKVYKRRFLRDFPDLVSKDPQRRFTNDQRIFIWRRANGKCQICDAEINLNQMHADHIICHNEGGKTTLENGRALCIPCNTSRGTT